MREGKMSTQVSKTSYSGQSYPCIAFKFEDSREAYEHMNYEIVKGYGCMAYGHYLFTWDDSYRMLAKCENCGGYILIQSSEFHSFTDIGDSLYTDWFPISSPKDADEANRKHDGFQIESEFNDRYLMITNGSLGWSR